MSRKSSRNVQRIDYQVLNDTGNKVAVQTISNLFNDLTVVDSAMDELIVSAESLREDILDFIDENDVKLEILNLNDIELYLSRISELRSTYRKKHKELQLHCTDYEVKFLKSYEETMSTIKLYIGDGNDARHKLRVKDHTKSEQVKKNEDTHVKFELNEIKRLLNEIDGELQVNLPIVTDDEITRRKENLLTQRNKMNSISEKISSIMMTDSSNYQVKLAMERYERFTTSFCDYEAALRKEVDLREIEKETLFKEKKLNIKLCSFKGYASAVDFYSFKSDFEKLYTKSTPRRLMSDLLKNNHLEGQALQLVKHVDDIDEIWERLKRSYGEPRVMLEKKLKHLSSLDPVWKSKDAEKAVDAISRIVNLMRDLMKLSEDHKIEAKLYYSDAIGHIYRVLGEGRLNKWFSSICDDNTEGKELWKKLIVFLEKDIRIEQQKALVWKKGHHREEREKNRSSYFVQENQDVDDCDRQAYVQTDVDRTSIKCFICGEEGHSISTGPGGIKLVQYYTCKKFVEMTPKQRFELLKEKKLCFQCLYPGASSLSGKHKEGKCQRDFVCRHQIHSRYPMKKHVLVCDHHKQNDENQVILQQFKERCIMRHRQVPDYSKNIGLSFHAVHKVKAEQREVIANENDEDIVEEDGIYLLQTVKIDQQCYNIFYDNGCSQFVSRKSAIDRIGDRAHLECPGPFSLGGVGGISTETPHGIYSVKFPLRSGKKATMTGLCLDALTSTFPMYPLVGKVEDDIRKAFSEVNSNTDVLPKLPCAVGGEVDFMIGIKYLRYFPKPVFKLESGLTIYESMFDSADGSSGVVGGPHEIFSAVDSYFTSTNGEKSAFFTYQLQKYREGFRINPDVSLLGFKPFNSCFNVDMSTDPTDVDVTAYASRRFKVFTEAEEAGTCISYRCVKCRNCKACREHDRSEQISIREEVEQDVITSSVIVNLDDRSTTARLPFMHDPQVRLAPNKKCAMKVFQQQVKKLNNNLKDKDDVMKSEAKLHALGHVDFVSNLTEDQQKLLRENSIQNFIPWRAVWKNNSISTPCRLVFDASQPTPTGYSLNDLLAKGRNGMNKLQEIFIRWCTHKVAFHTDIQKMYNSVKLREEDWCYQRYLWQTDLDPLKMPEEKVIKTLIYGVKSSGNQAEEGLRQTADLSQDRYPEVSLAVNKDIYVDDCLSGEHSEDAARIRADELELVLNCGGFTLKGVTFSGQDPPDKLTDDGETISVAGMIWHPKTDTLKLDVDELCFAKKLRGRKKYTEETRKIPLKLTRRHCASKIAEIYDLTGKVTPIVSSLKLDLHNLVMRKMDWDDVIPDHLRPLWLSNFEMIQELKTLTYKRAVIPEDAIDLKINTLDFGDASPFMSCSAIYARFRRRNDEFSCQLVLARSKIIPEGTTQPRAEMIAAVLNTHTGEVVRRSLGSRHTNHIKLSDSQVVLNWLNNEEKPLKQWVRNRVIESKRFTSNDDWYYVDSSNMIADLGTRRGTSVSQVGQDSTWINGYSWMKYEKENMPIKTVDELKLTNDEVQQFKKEVNIPSTFHVKKSFLDHDEVKKRYEFSRYVIDPNQFNFQKVVRILAIVLKFIDCLKKKKPKLHKVMTINDEELQRARDYFFRKGTLEVKKFVKRSTYEKFSNEKEGILIYTGRILSEDDATVAGRFIKSSLDLSIATFCVPVLDKHSPISYSIINDLHWNHKDVKHRGIETVWREVLKSAHVIEGRSIVKSIRQSCQRCRYLNKKSIDVAMGPLSHDNLMIAPVFYVTQVDLAGPFLAFSSHNKRTTIKIWMAVFCCCTTTAVSIKVMDSYNSSSFIQALIRLACEVGYPKKLMPDEGSQLVKSCADITFNFKDLKQRLFVDSKIDFEICPVGGHNMHGRVERKIKEVKLSIEKNLQNERLSLLQWETIAAEIANSINDMPLALGSRTGDFEVADLLTPNRLRLGRNNNRSPEGTISVRSDPDRFMKMNERIVESWFEVWLMSHVPVLICQPKWFNTSHDQKEGDIVLFLKQDSSLKAKYQYGVIESIVPSRDGLVRKANVRYQNASEAVSRITCRAVRQLVVIHSVNELNIVQELGDIAAQIDGEFKMQN